MKKTLKILLPLILLAFALSSCTATVGQAPGTEPSFIEIAYKSLAVSKETYDTSFYLLQTLHSQGEVTQNQIAKAIEYGSAYMTLHNDAVSALLKLKNSGLKEDKEIYLLLIPDLAKALSNLLTYLDPISKEVK